MFDSYFVSREAETFGGCSIAGGPACGEMSKLEMHGMDYEEMAEKAFAGLKEYDEDVNLNSFHLPLNFYYNTFIYSFQTYKDFPDDYPIANFESIFRPTVKITGNFKNTVFISKKKPQNSVLLDHKAHPINLKYILPHDTYAYTSTEPLILKFNRQVQFESFWLRLHHNSVEV